MLNKIKHFLISNSLYVITILVGLLFVNYLKSLKSKQLITDKEYISSFTTIVGWGIALLLGLMHLQKTRRDNRIAKKEEFKKSLEINAFREINKAVTELSDAISKLGVSFLILPGNLKLYSIDPSRMLTFDKFQQEQKLRNESINIRTNLANFILVIESNEIAVIRFDHYRKYIQFQFDDIFDKIEKFLAYFSNLRIEELITVEKQRELKERCDKLNDELWSIGSYLFDYRIELMNSIMGNIFDSRVPIRKPRDKKYKVLTEVAIKEEVEKEAEERESKVFKKKPGD